MAKDKAFTFRVPVDLLDAAHLLAASQDLSVAQLLRKVLKELVAGEKANG